MADYFFRAGVGAVLYEATTGEIALFRRAKPPAGIWQFPQGGIDRGETPTQTLWRELQEETGITATDVAQVDMYPDWLTYLDLHNTDTFTTKRLGQTHTWFFIQLTNKDVIHLDQATDIEFDDYRWTTWADAIACTGPHKTSIYQTLCDHFYQHILPDQS